MSKAEEHIIPVHNFGNREIAFDIAELDEAMMESYENPRSPHRHSYYEIFIFYKGGGKHTIDFKEYDIETNALHFISPGQVHLIKRTKGCYGYVITFPEDLYLINGQQHFLRQISLYHNYSEPPMFTCNAEEMKRFKLIIERLNTEYQSEGMMREELMRSYLSVILIHSNRIFQQQKKGKKTQPAQVTSDIVQRFRLLLDEHILVVQSVNGYAALLNITPNHLNDVVKKNTGITASAHISERILLEAKRLLLNTEYSAKEIAHALNFNDPAYFGRFFRKQTSCSPLDFRNQIRKKYQL